MSISEIFIRNVNGNLKCHFKNCRCKQAFRENQLTTSIKKGRWQIFKRIESPISKVTCVDFERIEFPISKVKEATLL